MVAKYSTGSSSTTSESCQLCGATEEPLQQVKVEGAMITVCADCNSTTDSDSRTQSTSSTPPSEAKTGTPDDETGGYTITNPNPDWVDDVNYGNTETPYMKRNYADTFTKALETQNLTLNDLAEETGLPIQALQAIQNNNVMAENLTKEIITTVEKELNIELAEKR